MRLPSILRQNNFGFTFIEVLIAVGIIGFIGTFGAVAGIDAYSRYNFNSGVEDAVALLQKARSESINNIGGKQHGVCFDDLLCPGSLVLFQGSSWAGRDAGFDIAFERPFNTTFGGSGVIVFEQLSGRALACSPSCSISIQGTRDVTVSVNYEGQIDY